MLEYNEIQRVFTAARANRAAVRARTSAERIERLEALRAALTAHAEDIGTAIKADLGRPTDNRGEFLTVMGNIDKAVAELADWMAPIDVEQSIPSPKGKRIFIKYEPRGVVLLFGTWDFPIGMFFSPLVQAVAAGNVVIGKTNSLAPATGKVIATIVAEAFAEDEVSVFDDTETNTPDGVRSTNDVLLDLPVDHIFLTGSPRVGKLIVAAAAKHLASFTLELGGKSPAIVDSTADLDYVAQQIVIGKIPNHGQTCLSVDYVWVPADRRDEFVEKYVAAVRAKYYDNGEFRYERDGRFVNRRNFERVKGYLDQAVEAGATIAFGGTSDADALVIEPTVLLDVPVDSDIIQEEIFGPLLPVLTYTDESEIYAHSDSLGKPLGLYIYSQDEDFVERVLDNTTSGGVTVNAHNVHWREENLPFGGVNSSGYGRYHGVWGFREFSNPRSVYEVALTPTS
ncbi:aldehyde dehydrogenase family protein [Actinacidiphila sp. ITFR-21]|uniref:aldehyde dehydrogenase family protein n=1 Tax=Actinacidiphila sp. ITFR-21 TaxID=3075199 RepID=UPI00288BA7F2|nr:aldehyde dehydrogenase family protein [Streptomyces sp. ITFR-21]WNI18741.1 aldehyde dehydrogenase family protein [Streptomyces sp. ITFR-21]